MLRPSLYVSANLKSSRLFGDSTLRKTAFDSWIFMIACGLASIFRCSINSHANAVLNALMIFVALKMIYDSTNCDYVRLTCNRVSVFFPFHLFLFRSFQEFQPNAYISYPTYCFFMRFTRTAQIMKEIITKRTRKLFHLYFAIP
ncbi:Lysoplasmalogenase [Dirofilaria immitis]